VALYPSAHPGVTLVDPEGTYRTARHMGTDSPDKNDAKHVISEALNDVHLVGCNATIDLKGHEQREADAMVGKHWKSWALLTHSWVKEASHEAKEWRDRHNRAAA
jgi:hypothetical protein